MAQSRIKTIQFTNEWKAPQGHMLYIHDIVFENGDAGKSYLKTKLPTELLGGAECTYILAGSSIKELQPVKAALSENGPTTQSLGSGNNQNLAGYCLRYATDVVIARINAKEKGIDPAAEIKKLSDDLYTHAIELGSRPF